MSAFAENTIFTSNNTPDAFLFGFSQSMHELFVLG